MESDASKTIAKRIGLAIRELEHQGWQVAVQQFLALEPELLALVEAEADRQEVRRRIHEAIVSHISVCEPAPDADAYERHWQQMLDVGFTNEERRMSMHFFRLNYLIDNAGEASGVETELARYGEAAVALTRIDAKLGAHFSAVHQRLQERLARR